MRICIGMAVGVVLMLHALSCADAKQDETAANSGAALAERYCQSCHLKPDPSLLPKERWSQSVLPVMGLFLGTTPVTVATTAIERSMFPSTPAMTAEEWQALVDYYVSKAPERLPLQPPTPALTKGLPQFTLQLPKDSSLYGTTSITSLCRIDTAAKLHRLYVGNSMTKDLLLFTDNLGLMKRLPTAGPVVDLCSYQGSLVSCHIGTNVMANDSSNGFIQYLNKPNDKNKNPLFDSLSRPVQMQVTDLNSDGKPDFLVAQFGNLKGQLTWMEYSGESGFVSHTIKEGAGALHFVVKDADGDGRPDVYALFAQGDERLLLFINGGNGKFKERPLLRFPPSYGSTYFDLVDFDGDGDNDIVYTCGH